MFNPNYRFLNQTESRGGASISFPPPQIQIIPNRPKGGGVKIIVEFFHVS